MILASLAAHTTECAIYSPDPSPDAPFLTLNNRGVGQVEHNLLTKANTDLLNPLQIKAIVKVPTQYTLCSDRVVVCDHVALFLLNELIQQVGRVVVEPLKDPINYTNISLDCTQIAPRAEAAPLNEQDESIFHTYALPQDWDNEKLTGQKSWILELYPQVRINPKTICEWVRLFKCIRGPEDWPSEEIMADLVRAIGTRTTDANFTSSVLQIIQKTPAITAELSRQRELLSRIDGTESIVEALSKQ